MTLDLHPTWHGLVFSGGISLALATGCTTAGPNDDAGPNSGIASVGNTDGDTDGNGDGDGDDDDDDANDGTGGTGDDDDDDDATDGDDDDDDDDDEQGELLFLEVTPINSIIELDIDEAGSQDFVVTAYYENGDQIDVTDEATFGLDNPMIGSMMGPTLDIPGFASTFFGSTIVTASVGDDTGEAQVTVAAYLQSGPQPDFFFVLPYEDPAGNQTKQLTFATDVKQLDVFFNMDTTGSMDGEVSNLQSSLSSTVIPGVEAQVMDTQFGVGAYEDFPIDPYGEANCTYGALGGPDQPFELFAEITDDVPAVQAAVNQLGIGGNAIGCGNDGPESAIEALYQIATGEGLVGPAPTSVASNISGIGGVGFREGSMPIIVNITDAVSHDGTSNACGNELYTVASVAAVAHDETETMAALNDICARVIQVATASGPACTAQADGIAWNNATGAVVPPEAWDVAGHPAGCAAGQCCTGSNGAGQTPDGNGMCPLTYLASFNGSGVDSSIVAGIEMVSRYATFDVTSEVTGVPNDIDGAPTPMGTTTADFIQAVTPASHGMVPVPGVPDPTLTPTAFEGVVPDTDVTFDIVAFNDFVPQGPDPRLFVATIRVLAGGCSDLDEREVFILVPPAELPPPG